MGVTFESIVKKSQLSQPDRPKVYQGEVKDTFNTLMGQIYPIQSPQPLRA